MIFSENTNNLFSALSKFHERCPQITKDASVKVSKGGKFKYEFNYATYGNILKTVKPILSECELSVLQSVGESGVQTVLMHSSGQYAMTDPLPVLQLKISEDENVNAKEQERGSSITYMKRYQLAALLLQDAEEDDDANIADGNEPEITKKEKPKDKPKKAETKQETPKTSEPEPETTDYEAFLASVEKGEVTDPGTVSKAYVDGVSGSDDKGEFEKKYHARTQEAITKIISS